MNHLEWSPLWRRTGLMYALHSPPTEMEGILIIRSCETFFFFRRPVRPSRKQKHLCCVNYFIWISNVVQMCLLFPLLNKNHKEHTCRNVKSICISELFMKLISLVWHLYIYLILQPPETILFKYIHVNTKKQRMY